MIEFEIKSRKLNIGKREGQTVYYASPKAKQKYTNQMVINQIVRETSLSSGDVRNALDSLCNIVSDALLMGATVDLAQLGSLRFVVPSKMMDSKDDVTVKKALKTPKIQFTPKQAMRDAANSVELSIDKGNGTKSTNTGEGSGDGDSSSSSSGNSGGGTEVTGE